ncbi:MAG TPA: hypothetical protein VMY37_09665 [Thermoguttaceae bacterium]|nr:hypothetical protein [Thermoguttaceae bacterium]
MTFLWIVISAVGIVCIICTLKWLDRLLLQAEEKGWIYYRRKSGGGTVSAGIGAAMTELDRIARPSAEYRIEAEAPVVEEDEKGGE